MGAGAQLLGAKKWPEKGKPERRQCWSGGGKGALLGMPIRLRVPDRLEEREQLMPGRQVPLLCSTQ